MSFKNPDITLTFTREHNTANRNYNADTFMTDFGTGRSWVEPMVGLRFYRDGAVALHTSGNRDPYTRNQLYRYGIQVELFSDIVGKLYTSDGERVTRGQIKDVPRTVLVEGDRIYPLQRWGFDRSKSPIAQLPAAYDHDAPLVVWPNREAMPSSSYQFTVKTPDKQRAAAWWERHGEDLKINRVTGALLGSASPARGARLLDAVLLRMTGGHALDQNEQHSLYLASMQRITKTVEQITATNSVHNYLIVKE